MNWLDLVLVLIIGVSVVTSLRKGLSREVIGLVSVVVALLLAAWFYGTAGALVAPYVSSPSIAHFIGFTLVFAAVLLLGGIVSFIVGRFLKVTGLSIFDHLLGTVFGLVRGVLIGVALVMGLMAFSPSSGPPPGVVHSRVAPYVLDAARVVASMSPHEVREGFRKTYTEVKSAWGKTLQDGIRKLPGSEKKENERKI
jgi:membrane protein required for colicin V production